MLSLDLARHPDAQNMAHDLTQMWEQSGDTEKAARLRAGDIADLLPVIAEIEEEHRAWVAEDPETRHFGPPSPFGPSNEDKTQMIKALATAAGLSPETLLAKMKSGDIDRAALEALMAKRNPT